ncbi:MAG: alpha-mannosidase [Akkermansiaceae bacterium]|nr:alpha-mannosidase [Armatimonadota bacterium]
MPESPSQFFVVGITHVDLAWKRGRAEMSEMMEIVVIRLLDALEQKPDFRYHIEQAAHFRELQRRRPDLVARLRPFIEAGRVEIVGGMASTLECNLPNGECFVRNQQIGLDWVRDTWGVGVKTGWLVDTFGVAAQVPQILRGFGIEQLMASRFGGTHTRDLFVAHGLDGSRVTVAGWSSQAGYMHPENVAWQFYKDWDGVDRCFALADQLTGPGPFLVLPYTENEMLVSLRPHQITRERNLERAGQTWCTATPAEFFDAVAKTGRVLPVVDSDLNPEFTGCFSLRHAIRLANRRMETRLLEAEKWAALAGLEGSAAALENDWWELAYVQFHDVFTGSHPTVVFEDVMRVLDEIERSADRMLVNAFEQFAPKDDTDLEDASSVSATVFNGLPWHRTDTVEIQVPSGWAGIARVTDRDGTSLSFAVKEGIVAADDVVRVRCDVPATGYATIQLEAGAAEEAVWNPVGTAAAIENAWIRVEFDTEFGVKRLVWKPTGAVLLENAGSWLVAQRDDGNFQIENPSGAEVGAASGTIRLEEASSPLGQTVRLSGEFPPLDWAGAQNHLRWTAEFFLPEGSPAAHLALHLDWKGEATRIRLTLPTAIDSATGIYEVPFGVACRKPYSPRVNAKGEWPAHRFVTLADARYGVALINTGVGGVEVSGGTIYTTLLRAPRAEYAGMVADMTSSQHGTHDYSFAILPYAGIWVEAGVLRVAQEVNNPLIAARQDGTVIGQSSASFLSLEPANVVLSGIKSAADGSGDVIVRVYETAGRATEAVLTVSDTWADRGRVWTCDLRENRGEGITSTAADALRFTLQPFQIQTLRFGRSPQVK